MHTTHEYKPSITAGKDEQQALKKLEQMLSNANNANNGEAPGKLTLVGPDGEQAELPKSVVTALSHLLYHLSQNHTVTLVPMHRELTTQEAANLLNVSRPYLVKLLEQGDIPYTHVGAHRRVRYYELMEYKKRRSKERRAALALLTQLGQEMGDYE